MKPAAPLTALPPDRARPSTASGARHRAGRDAGAAPLGQAEAAVAALLARSTGDDEVAYLAVRPGGVVRVTAPADGAGAELSAKAVEAPAAAAGPALWAGSDAAEWPGVDAVFSAGPAGWRLSLDADLHTAAATEALLDAWVALARALAEAPARPVATLPALDAAGVAAVLATSRAAVAPFPVQDCLHARVEAAADRFGRRVAVTVPAGACPAVSLSYAELDARANQLAHRLLAEGLAPEALVGVFLERSAELVVAILAILKAGGAYLPLDLSYPKERLAFILEDAHSPLILTTSKLQADLPETGARALCLDLEAAALEALPSARPRIAVPPERLAYVIYTSGSTGAPKGVMVTHADVVRLFDATEAWFGFGEADVWTLFHSHAFDFSVWELFGALGSGGRLVVVPYLVSRAPDAFLALLAEERVTVLNQTPSSFRQLIRAEGRTTTPAHLDLRYVIFGGEALELASLAPWVARHGDARPQLVNMYGITETTVHVTYRPITQADLEAGRGSVIGRPIPDLELFVLDPAQGVLPPLLPGELYVAGAGLARGYLGRDALTAERFITADLGDGPRRLYRTGDRARRTPDGDVEYLGRVDLQVKLRGFRIELQEIEAHLVHTGLVSEAVVVVREDEPGQPRLVAYVVPAAGPVDVVALRGALLPLVPPYMVPSFFVVQDSLPLTRNGKVDRRALPPPTAARPELPVDFVPPGTPMERRLAALWRATLGLTEVGLDDNFFDLGGTSLLVADLREAVEGALGRRVEVVTFFQHPTVRALAAHLEAKGGGAVFAEAAARARRAKTQGGAGAVAIVGMAGRFPGADDVPALWANLVAGRDTITHFTQAELTGTELDLERVFSQPGYVAARGVVVEADRFDARFFGMNPREAALMDPQHRVWLEEAYHALEDAGCDPATYPGRIGVFAGSFTNNHLLYNLARDRDYVERYVRSRSADALQILVSNDKDFLASRVAYQLDLKGPAMAIQCGCSTSLVAVVKAYQSLLAHESDVCLAGGVCISQPQARGYLYNEGGMTSADGACRAFDAGASGTVFSNGAAVVVLKRLEDALADGDPISAVIRGAALNNDGAVKMSYTAPSVDGQAEVIVAAQARAEVEPDSVGYVEAHGTGTPLGDPIEVAALTRAFRRSTDRKQYCGLGSVKSNVGHMDAAAGVTGLIKAALVLDHEQIPPTVHFQRPNPELHLEESPFFVVDTLRPWPRGAEPRRAGVSAFGVGGTNAHVVLEEAPAPAPSGPSRGAQVVLLSGRDGEALDRLSSRLGQHLAAHPELPLADVAHTLRVGRRALPERQVLVARSREDAAQALLTHEPRRVVRGRPLAGAPQVVFMFPGQGSQHVDMGRALYEREPVFRRHVDEVTEILRPILGLDLRAVMYPRGEQEEAARILRETGNTQPALFVVEHALARLWMSWGVEPTAMVGHSVGEYAAACLAEVFSVEDAATVLATRARLMQSMPGGQMRAVRLDEAALAPHLVDGVALAAVNAPGLTVVSGPDDAIAALEARLAAAGQEVIALHTSHAFHSAMMDPVLGPFEAAVAAVRRRPPRRPFVSTLTGTWITDAEATDPGYWARQLRHTVRFSAALETLFEVPHRLLLEVGPSQNLSTSARQHRAPGRSFEVVSSLGGPRDARPADEALMEAVGRLWIAGAPPDWAALAAGESRRKVRLPGYPFERVRHWVEPPPLTAGGEAAAQASLPSEAAAPAPAAPTAPAAPGVRADRIRAKLRALLLELSGIDIAEGARQTPFTDMGFDSLFLTQASAEIQAQLGVKVKFRRLLEDVTTLDALTALLDAELPPDALPAPVVAPAPSAPAPARALAPAPAAAPAPASAPAAGGFLEEVIRTQLAVMNQQLEALRGGAVAPPAAPTSATQPAEAPAGVPVSASYAKDKGRRGAVPYRPIEKAPGGGLTEVQQRHLDGLIQRLGAKTRTSKAQAQQHRRTHADPRGVSGFKAAYKELVYQLVMERSLGARIWDVDGNEYVDITGGFGINFLGYSPPFVRAAVEAQLEKGLEVAPQSPLAGEVADLFCKLTGHDRVFFVNTGSEAVMAAVRLARTVTGRSRIAYFAGAYHGVHDEVLGRAQNNGGRLVTLSAAPGVPAAAVSEALVLEYGAEESLELIQRHAHELAAVLIEPVQSRVPELVPVEFLRRLRAITEASGTAFIMDEVITGFRAHLGGLQAAWGIKADLATYGKVVGGGMPIGVVAGKAAFMDAVDGGAWRYGDASVPEADVTYFAGTFHRHPVALAAAKAVLEHLERAGPSLQEDLNARTAAFVGRLNAALEGRGVPVRLSHFSSWFRFEIPSDVVYAPLLAFHLLERGVYCRQIGQNNFFSTTHTDADLAFIERAILDGVDALLAADFLPRAAGAPAVAAVAAAAPTPALPARAAPPRAPQPGAPPPDGPLPLSEAQREIWLTSQMGPGASCAFNESFTLDLVGPLSQAALRQALTQLLARHHALSFVFAADGQSQRHQPAPLVLTEHPEGEDLEALRRAEATTPFELQRGPLSRWHLARRGPEHHQLIFTVHHIVLDGWSAGVVLEDLGALYTAALRGEPDASPPAQAYADYVAWEQRTQAGAEGAASLEYWRRLFLGLEGAPATEPPALELPTDRPRPPLKGFLGDSHQGRVPADVLAAAKAAARREGVTLFAFLLSAWHTLLYRLSGQTDLTVGVPVAGQAVAELPRAVGHAVNFLPTRLRVEPDAPFSQLVRTAKAVMLDAHEHQHATFGSIVRHVKFSRERNRLPFIQVVFNLDRRFVTRGFEGLEVEIHDNVKRHVNFDLFLNLIEDAGGLGIKLDYDAELFDPETMARWMDAYTAILADAARDPSRPVRAVELLSEAERRRLLQDLNDTAGPVPQGSLHELLRQEAARHPERVAVRGAGPDLTSAGLMALSARVAGLLADHGVAPGDRVGVCLRRTPSAVGALLGVLEAGAAYVPLDPEFPPERLALIAEDADLKVVLTEAALAEVAARLSAPAVRLEAADAASPRPPAVVSGDATAYLIYTSGSTGRPKGVAVPHRAVVAFLAAMLREPGLTAQDTLLAVTTFSFDIHVLELFLPLFVGGGLYVAPSEALVGGAPLQDALTRSGATVMQATPSLWRVLLDAGWAPPPGFKALCGGEALPRDLADALAARAELWNMFGPTETTVWSLVARVAPGAGPVSIGRPIMNTRAYVLDEARQPVPVGVPGELYLGGAGVATGYHGRPELTAERFLADPFAGTPGARMYRTGDRARWSAAGALDFLGRVDLQVKVRGHRIELAEIDLALGRHPGVGERATVVREDRPGDRRLVAYYEPAPGAVVTSTELRTHLRGALPEYMVPQHFVEVVALPRTPNGKIDRRRLVEAFGIGAAPVDHFAPPRTDAEKMLAGLFSEALGVARVGLHDNFFALGGHSLLAMSVLLEVERRTGQRWTTQQMVFSDLEQLAAQLPRAAAPQAAAPPPPAPPPPRAAPRAGLGRRLFATLRDRVKG